ncbi:DUF3039 family protein [Herbihabitans rhizosphaerae]|uniref:DUF3039 family protein n=2 Tax=Herbihabitans rhizosphaerae TaxID=1872711 RepID=A0A4Q7KH86_9PSEU|nr:DUF3039 family protein [Herbihabitans rhizosphaerae]
MIVEGTTLVADAELGPCVRALCGRLLPARTDDHGLSWCPKCSDLLADWISENFDLSTMDGS